MNLNEFKTKYLGKQVEYHSYGNTAFFQCVDLVNAYIKEVLGLTPIIGTNACDFVSKFVKGEFDYIVNTPKGIPNAGDIIVWNNKVGGGAGHVAIVLEANVNSFKSLDQNWSKVERVTEETHNYSNVLGWLKPIKKEANTIVSETIHNCTAQDIDTKTESTFKLKDYKRYDKHWTYGDLIKDWKLLNEELDKQKIHFDTEIPEAVKVAKRNCEANCQQTITEKESYIRQLEATIQEKNGVINNKADSARFYFNTTDLVKWLKNLGLFGLLPILITYLASLTGQIPQNTVNGVIILALLNAFIDFLKKLVTDNGS